MDSEQTATERDEPGTNHDETLSTVKVDAWYSEAIGKVRATADPGGDALTLEQARAFRDKLDGAIEEAEADA